MPFLIFVFIGTYLLTDELDGIFRLDIDSLLLLGLIFRSIFLIRIYLRRVYQKEFIIVTDKLLILSQKFIFETKRQEFKKDEIMDLKYIGREDYTRHPLEPKGFDYIGFGAGEREVEFFIERGNLAFYYNGTIFRFGKDVWEEEGREIIEKLKETLIMAVP